MRGAAHALAASELFGGIPAHVLDDIGRLMSPTTHPAGATVFRQGEPGHSFLVVERGELECLLAVPGDEPRRIATISAGDVVGELSMLGDGRRTATVRAIRDAAGWSLERAAFDVMRQDARPAATSLSAAVGRLAVDRLNRLHRRSAEEFDSELRTLVPIEEAVPVGPEPGETDYLLSTLFFADLEATEVDAVTAGLRRLELARGAFLVGRGTLPGALWIVVRGAIETTLRGRTATQRLRLAGPGRAVGHVGVLGSEGCVDGVESRARERTILLEVPWPRVHQLLGAKDRASRRFASAFWRDAVRALQHGERPLARMHGTEPCRLETTDR